MTFDFFKIIVCLLPGQDFSTNFEFARLSNPFRQELKFFSNSNLIITFIRKLLF